MRRDKGTDLDVAADCRAIHRRYYAKGNAGATLSVPIAARWITHQRHRAGTTYIDQKYRQRRCINRSIRERDATTCLEAHNPLQPGRV